MTIVMPLEVDIWSDIACPWCYVGKRRLEAALSGFEHADAVQLTWHAFQLDPGAPRESPARVNYAERLGRKYGTSEAGGQEMIDRMVAVAAEEGITMDFTRIRPSNTFDAHRLLHAAKRIGLQAQLKERLLRAYLCEGESMGDAEALVRLGSEVGLAPDEVQGVLQSDLHADAVKRDLAEAGAMGISGVPFFVFGRRYAVSGAQPASLLLQALSRAWADLPQEAIVDDGAVCGPDGC